VELGLGPFRVHPSALIGDEESGVVDLWRDWRGSGMGTPGHLPFAGGAADQPALLVDAFRLLDWAAEQLKEKEDFDYEVLRRVRRS